MNRLKKEKRKKNELKAINILKKYFCFKFSSMYDSDKIDFLSIQAWSDLDTYDTSAYENIINYNDIVILKEVFDNE